MTAPAQLPPPADTCVCGDPRSSHRLGRKGCKEADCGCDRFEATEDRVERERVLAVVADVCEEQAAKARAELAAITGAEPAPDPVAQVIDSYDAYACPACGSRYGQPYTDHGCGPLIPVTVTITRREVANV